MLSLGWIVIKGLRACNLCDEAQLMKIGDSPSLGAYYPGMLVLICSLGMQICLTFNLLIFDYLWPLQFSVLQELRTLAIFSNSKAVKISFIVIDVLAVTGFAVLRKIQAKESTRKCRFQTFPDIPTYLDLKEFTTLVLVPFFVVEVIIFFMGVYKSYVTYSQLRGVVRSPLIDIILGNNIFYFLLYVSSVLDNERSHLINLVGCSSFTS